MHVFASSDPRAPFSAGHQWHTVSTSLILLVSRAQQDVVHLDVGRR